MWSSKTWKRFILFVVWIPIAKNRYIHTTYVCRNIKGNFNMNQKKSYEAKLRMKVWNFTFGKDCWIGQCPSGRVIKRDCNNPNSPYYWTIEHIYPINPEGDKNPKGANALINLYPVTKEFNELKKNSRKFVIDGIQISVVSSLTKVIKKIEGLEDKKGAIYCYLISRKDTGCRFCIYRNRAYLLHTDKVKHPWKVVDILDLVINDDRLRSNEDHIYDKLKDPIDYVLYRGVPTPPFCRKNKWFQYGSETNGRKIWAYGNVYWFYERDSYTGWVDLLDISWKNN